MDIVDNTKSLTHLNHIFLFAKCGKREYLEDLFYGGNFFFNNLYKWSEIAEYGNIGQGDLLEGICSNVVNDVTIQLRKDAEIVLIGNHKYLRSEEIFMNWPCICFYSISHATEVSINQPKLFCKFYHDFLKQFYSGDFEKMNDAPVSERLSIVIIYDTGTFLRRMRSFFSGLGLVEDVDFFMHTVKYYDNDTAFVSKIKPYELFHKEKCFQSQKEFRIALNPNNEKVKELFLNGHKIHLFPINDIAHISPCGYDGPTAIVDIEKKTVQIMHSVKKGKSTLAHVEEWTFKRYVQLMSLAYHTTTITCRNGDELPVASFWAEISRIFYAKYNIYIEHELFQDDKDDVVYLWCDGDNPDEIIINEENDEYYYLRRMNVEYISNLNFNSLLGGHPSGVVTIKYWTRKEI